MGVPWYGDVLGQSETGDSMTRFVLVNFITPFGKPVFHMNNVILQIFWVSERIVINGNYRYVISIVS